MLLRNIIKWTKVHGTIWEYQLVGDTHIHPVREAELVGTVSESHFDGKVRVTPSKGRSRQRQENKKRPV